MKKILATPLEAENQMKPIGFINEKELLAQVPISRRTAFNWVQEGKIPCVKIGRRKLFHWPSVEAALLRLQRGGLE
jgi:predicted DNA-binding transcriptional regulator AlpA